MKITTIASTRSSAATTPIDVTYEADYDLAAHGGSLRQGDVRVGKAVARLTGRFSTSGEALTVVSGDRVWVYPPSDHGMGGSDFAAIVL